MIEDNRFLVIGSNSFTGSNFIARLISSSYECIGISRSQELEDPFLPYKLIEAYRESFKFYQLDLNNDQDKITALIKEEEISHIVNFAAQSMVGQSWDFPEDWYKTNVVSISQFVNKIRDIESIKNFVSVTTPEVYGSTDGWVKENSDFKPSTPYAISRAAQDMHLRACFENFKFPVTFTRAANVYGPGQSLYRIIPRTLIEALTDGNLILDGGGKSERSFIHVDDVCDATLKICLKGELGSTYHISTDQSIQIIDLVNLIAKICNKDLDDFVSFGPERPGKDSAYLLDSQKLRNELSWKDEITIERGLTDTLEWMEKNIDFLKTCKRDYIHKK